MKSNIQKYKILEQLIVDSMCAAGLTAIESLPTGKPFKPEYDKKQKDPKKNPLAHVFKSMSRDND